MWRYWLDGKLDDLGMFLAKGRRFESQILNNIFFLNTQFNSKIFRRYLVLLILFSNQMVISNETRNREANFHEIVSWKKHALV